MSDRESDEREDTVVDWVDLSPEYLLRDFTTMTVEDMLKYPSQIYRSLQLVEDLSSVYSVIDFDNENWNLPLTSEFNWTEMEKKVDTLLKIFVDRSNGGVKEVKMRLCTDESVFYIADNCPNLELLWFTSCPSVTDESIIKIAKSCQKLKEIRIRTSPQITEKSLKIVKENCPEVQILDK